MVPAETASRFSLSAAFVDEERRDKAAAELRRSGLDRFDTFSPFPAHEIDSLTPRVALAGGLLGFAGGFAMQVYANMIGYPLNIGGRPKLSWPSFVPIAFEIGIGLAVIAAIVAAFISAGLLKLHDPVDEADLMKRAMSDRWILALHAPDGEALRRAREICLASGATEIEEAGP